MKIFCCKRLIIHTSKSIKEGRDICYEPEKRGFYIYFAGSKKFGTYIDYCPFCGSKLPEDLIDEREKVILEELGSEYLPDDEGNPPKKDLPPEFKTDEWWKKRGL